MIKLVRRAVTLIIVPMIAAGAALTVTATPSSAASATTLAKQVVSLTNKYRAGKCGKVKANSRLNKAAAGHSAYQAKRKKMTHTGSGGTSFVTRAKRAGYSGALGENVAWGHPTASAVMKAWMKSPGHKKNILNCKAKSVGVAVRYSSKRVPYWTQVFGRS